MSADKVQIIECGVDDIDDYCSIVLNDEIPTCNYTKLAVERFQRDLENQNTEDFQYYFEPAAAQHFFDFVEGYLKHFQGHFSGKPIILQPFQKFILGQLFGWLQSERIKDTAIRRFSEASIFMGKKNGKSMVGAMIALYFLLFEGDSAEVYNIAINRNHSKKLSWQSARKMIKNSEELRDLFAINNSIASLGIKCKENGSFYEPIATKSDTADGLNVSCAIFDESKDNTDFKMVDTIKAGTTTRLNPLFLNISTAGFRTDTVGYRYYQRDVKVLEGKITANNVLSIIYTIDEGDEEIWDDEDVWKKANPLFSESITQRYFKERIEEGRNNVRVKNDILVKNLNLFGKSAEGWMDIEKWDECHDENLKMEDVAHLPSIITMDLSSKLDLSSIKITFFDGTTAKDVKAYPFDFFFLPEDRLSRNGDKTDKYLSLLNEWKSEGDIIIAGESSIDYQTITNTIVDLVESYSVEYIAYDPWHSDSIIKDLLKAGIPEDDLIEYTQIGYKNWDTPLRELEKIVIDKRLIHNGNKVMRWCMENVAVKENNYQSIRPVKISEGKKIDGVITLGMAIGVFIISDFGQKKNKNKRNLSPIAQRIMAKKQSQE